MQQKSQDLLARIINLTLAIYRLTDRFPKGEAMTGQLRRLSNELVGDLVMGNFDLAQKKIEIVLAYIKICRAQKWVQDINWLILENECLRLRQDVDFIGQNGEEEKKDEEIKNA